ncbi:hypothetical protein [Virgibacillus kimchii]
MLVCSKCNNEQESGKFCGVCGAELEAVQNKAEASQPIEAEPIVSQTGADQAAAAQPQLQETTEAVKSGLSQYWAYATGLLKNPAHAFQLNENHLVNGIISIALYVITFSLSIYFLINSLANQFSGGLLGESVRLPFFAVNFRLVLVALLLFLVAFGSALAITKLAKNQESFKLIISQYGGLIVPFIALHLVAVIGGLSTSVQLTMVPLVISLTIVILYIPVLFVYEKVSKINSQGQKIYLSLAVLVLISVIFYVLGESMFAGMLEEIEYMIDDLAYYSRW